MLRSAPIPGTDPWTCEVFVHVRDSLCGHDGRALL